MTLRTSGLFVNESPVHTFSASTVLTVKYVSTYNVRKRTVEWMSCLFGATVGCCLEEKFRTVKTERLTFSRSTKVVKSSKLMRGLHAGLVSSHACNMLKVVRSIWQPSTITRLNVKEHFILLFMRQCVCWHMQYLMSCRFGISPCFVCGIFHSWKNVLMTYLGEFMVWPYKEILWVHLPAAL